jgi:group I intron endonuclease
VEILAKWPTENEAFEHEKFLISCFRDMGFKLVNLSDGGDGQSGYKHTPETKKKISVAGTGRKPSANQIENASARMLGNKQWLGKKHTEETKKKISTGNKGKLVGSKSPRFGKPIPDSQKQAISSATSGANHRSARAVMCVEAKIIYQTCTDASVAMTGSKNSRSTISKAAQDSSRTLYGYHWKFI